MKRKDYDEPTIELKIEDCYSKFKGSRPDEEIQKSNAKV